MSPSYRRLGTTDLQVVFVVDGLLLSLAGFDPRESILSIYFMESWWAFLDSVGKEKVKTHARSSILSQLIHNCSTPYIFCFNIS
jgi:hypothetical protein